ncbi:hypothetical protein BDV95DRAFT_604681 [Massariosphaeria phaeospora]|uniref:Uncharacterized protein n=1 Tax=Massariosphaeria phaeospora TaxID=100035 RepID=A0A7C8IJQ5_9PLEO|nr:hypothetical protein BDV95DRAFT_604681 [Massariosphaeria phaeospora]
MDLPPELRCWVLEHVLGTTIWPERLYDNSVVLGSGLQAPLPSRSELHPFSYHIATTTSPGPNYAIFRVSRTIHAEALQLGWQVCRKHFKSGIDFEHVTQCPNAPTTWNWLTRIQLAFNGPSFFNFLGIQVMPSIVFNHGRSKGPLLQGISTLKDLELEFHDPYARDDDQAWYGVPGIRKFPCHKTYVDWTMTFLFPFIKGIPKVRLSGHVKTDIKQKWTQILETEYRERNEDWRTHGFNWDNAMNSILRISPANL